MANIPSKAYAVQLNTPTNNWANGALNTNQTPPTYKGVAVSSGYSLDASDVHWSVGLTHQNTSYTLNFTGIYVNPPVSPNTHVMNGTVTGLPTLTATSDTWTAD